MRKDEAPGTASARSPAIYYFNVLLTLVTLAALFTELLPLPVVFVVAFALALVVTIRTRAARATHGRWQRCDDDGDHDPRGRRARDGRDPAVIGPGRIEHNTRRMTPRVFHHENVDPTALAGETIAVVGYGIQGRAQALNLRDSGACVIVGNRSDQYRDRAERDGFDVLTIGDAVERGTIVLLLVPDEMQPDVFRTDMRWRLRPGQALILAHGFAVRYGLLDVPDDVDLMLLAPRLPGQFVRAEFVDGWGVPALVAVERDATGRAWPRLLGVAQAIGATRPGAIESSIAEETELDHFSEHFLYPLVFAVLETAHEALVEAGYAPEVALMELYGSGELGGVLTAAAGEGLYEMIRTHASPACQVGIAHHWDRALGDREAVRRRISDTLGGIRDGSFARHLIDEQRHRYPELESWRQQRSPSLVTAEHSLRRLLRQRPASLAQRE